MPVLPLFQTPNDPDAWHRVTAPGGYECWSFDAEDAARDLRVIATFWEGFGLPESLRRYQRYRRRPTRVAPPVPAEYPYSSWAIYEGGKVLGLLTCPHQAGTFSASQERPDVRIGPNAFRREDDGSLRVALHHPPTQPARRGERAATVELTFRPLLPHRPIELSVRSKLTSDATHRWVVANPLCHVEGTIRIGGGTQVRGDASPARERTIGFSGLGYHDHTYGTAPILAGIKRSIRGRVLAGDRAFAFVHSERHDRELRTETHLVEADGDGVRDWPSEEVTGEGLDEGRTRRAYPDTISIRAGPRQLTLTMPHVTGTAARSVRLAYHADWGGGERGRAICEVASGE